MKRIAVFWHIYIPNQPHRSFQIINRQFELLKSSGLIDVSTIYIGVVGSLKSDTLKKILSHQNVVLCSHATNGYEGVTTHELWKFCKNATDDYFVLYFHSRGSSYTRKLWRKKVVNGDKWTLAMEALVIRQWKVVLEYMRKNKSWTSGCELWNKKHSDGFPLEGFHYVGNFWWALPSFMRKLPDPVVCSKIHRGTKLERFVCGEFWLHLNWDNTTRNKHFILHYTGREEYKRGLNLPYNFKYDEKYYSCSDKMLPQLLSRTMCR